MAGGWNISRDSRRLYCHSAVCYISQDVYDTHGLEKMEGN